MKMYSEDLRKKSIDLYFKFNSLRKVAELLDIGKSTIHRWVKNMIIPAKMDMDNMINFIKKLIDNDKFITIRKIRDEILKISKKMYSLSFIYTIVKKKLNYSYKKVSNKLYSNIEILKEKREKFIKKIRRINKNKIISIDETYLYSNHSKNYGWNKRGERLFNYKKCNPIKYSIIMAITNKKIIHYEIYKHNIKGNHFYDFIKKINRLYNNHYILLDNVSFHKSNRIKNLVERKSNELLFIPPYSPEFNPIEELFSQIKTNILNMEKHLDVNEKFKRSIKLVNSKHLKNYYKHAYKNISTFIFEK